MTHNIAKWFWRAYIGMITKDGAEVDMFNPLDDFKARARSRELNFMADDQYYSREAEAEELSSFWNYKHSETVGNVLLNAIAKTNLSDAEIKDIAAILADASVRSDYCPADPEEPGCEEEIFNPDLDFSPVDGPTPFDNPSGWKPRSIYDYLNQNIYGQEAAKKAVSMLVYHHLNGNRRNIVMAGASGCGKTEIWRVLSKKFDCIRIVNGPQLTCDNWKGSYHIKDIFIGETKERAEHLIIVVDEADKLFEPAIGSGGTDFARKIQNEMLKIMDGDTLTFVEENNKGEKMTVDCSGVSVVFCGSFERMLQEKTESSGSIGFYRQGRTESTIVACTEEDLVQYANVRREIAGRINQIVTLDALDASDFEAILDGEMSPIQKIEKTHQVSLSVDRNTKKRLALDAAESGLGCRYICSRLQAMLDEKMFDAPEAKEYRLYYE